MPAAADGRARGEAKRREFARYKQLLRFANVSLPCDSPAFSWSKCCDFRKFDMFGSDSCFLEYPSWEMQMCCALSKKGLGMFNELLRLKFDSREDQDAVDILRQVDAKVKARYGGGEPVFVLYRKTGHRFVQSLLHAPATLARYFGLSEASAKGFNVHYGGMTASAPFYQGWFRGVFAPEQGPGRFPEVRSACMLGDPLYSTHAFASHFQRSLIVHLVRNPGSLVVSAYGYHVNKVEPWQRLKHPPSCLNCDYWAFVEIFKHCKFRCSYDEVLKNSSVREGLGIEVIRSRWQMVKMLRNLRLWQESPYVLHLQLEHFEAHFERTFGCLLRFLLQRPPPAPLPPDSGALLAEVASFAAPRHVRQRCEGGAICGERAQAAQDHMSSLQDRKRYRQEFVAGGWEKNVEHLTNAMRALLAGSNTSRVFGCPDGRRLL